MKKEYNTIIEERQAELALRLDRSWQPETKSPVFANTGQQIQYQVSDRIQAVDCGGLGLIQQLTNYLGLAKTIDDSLDLLKRNLPYHESDHILNIVYCLMSGGQCLEDIKLRRKDLAYLNALNARRIPDATTAGDFLRRFKAEDVEAFMDAINDVRRDIWLQQPASKRTLAVFDVDGTIEDTTGQCKQGADFAYNGKWGYGPLVITLANSREVMFIVNRSANRPSHDGAPAWMDKAREWAKSAGFKGVRFRGDTDFSLTAEFDRWTEDSVEFVFGMDANKAFVKMADQLDEDSWQPLERKKREILTTPRQRPFDFKEAAVIARGYKNKRLQAESVAVIDTYKPTKARRTYRLVILRKNISIAKGEKHLLDEVAYFFYVTNIADMTPHEVVFESNARCNQENIIKQAKSGVHAIKAPAVEFVANWAYMAIATLAWNLKVWLALILPRNLGAHSLIRMDMRRFINEVMRVPAQILHSGGRLIFRLLSVTSRTTLIVEGSSVLRR